MTRNIQLLIAYDGTDFHGWQAQKELRTVQSELEGVLQHVVRHPVNLIASGRTDAGVHAAGQVTNFLTRHDIPADKLVLASNSRLPHDVTIIRAREVPLGFHATRSALSKLYRYRIYNVRRRPLSSFCQQQVYHYYQHKLDIHLMREGAARLVGEHNFKAFASTKGPERLTYVRKVIRCDVYEDLEEVRFDVEGNGFLYNQIRNIVGTLLEIGRGHWAVERITEILASQDRTTAGSTAPAQGLCLQWVRYPPDREIPDAPNSSTANNRIEEENSTTGR